MYKYILAFDPSGSFDEGKGTTGFVLMNHKEELLERGYIPATDYKRPEEYWNNHIVVLKKYHDLYEDDLIVVIEQYVLYKDRAASQTNSQMETCRLIGLMQWWCWKHHQPYVLQLASQVKQRWSDEILLRDGIIYRSGKKLFHTQSNLGLSLSHTRDAFRHAQHYAVCRNKPIKYNPNKPIKDVKPQYSNY